MIKDIINENIKKVNEKDSEALKDRTQYVGASDVGQCPLKVVKSKLNPPEYDSETLVKFKRGHLAETILAECFAYTQYRWETQMEFIHPKCEYIRAHADFVFYTKDFSRIGIVEQKSVSSIPDEPYSSWVEQLQFQMGLAKLVYPDTEVKGAIFVVNLNSGKFEEFNGFIPDEQLFGQLMDKAQMIYDAVQQKDISNLSPEPDSLCVFCPFKATCPEFTGDEKTVPEEIVEKVKEYQQIIAEEKELKAKKEDVKNDIIGFTGNDFQARFNGYKLSVKETVRQSVDTKLLKTEYKDIYESVLKEIPYVSFRIS